MSTRAAEPWPAGLFGLLLAKGQKSDGTAFERWSPSKGNHHQADYGFLLTIVAGKANFCRG
jgi:hypothetical protein